MRAALLPPLARRRRTSFSPRAAPGARIGLSTSQRAQHRGGGQAFECAVINSPPR